MIFFSKKIVIIIGAAITVTSGIYLYQSSQKEPAIQTAIATRSDLVQMVSVTGRVQAPESVNLSFERSGRISFLALQVSSLVHKGQVLAQLDAGDLSAQLGQAQANAAVERAKLDELRAGVRPEEVQIARTKVANAELALADAQTNVLNVQNKASSDLDEDYDGAITAMPDALDVARQSLIIANDMRRAYFSSSSQEGSVLVTAIALATSFVEQDAAPAVQSAMTLKTDLAIAAGLTQTNIALGKTKDALNSITILTQMTSADKASINSEKDVLNNAVITISSKQQAISAQKVINANAISSAQSSVNSAESALAVARGDLTLKEAGSSAEQIAAQEARVLAAEANERNVRAQIAKTILSAPFNGIVTRKDAQAGEIISASTPIISLISDANLELSTNIPEADIVKVAIGNRASVTLDAYGRDELFEASVAAIDPAGTLIDGVATYKVTLQFENGHERAKAGMTANIDIITAEREEVIIIPARALISKDGEKVVRVLEGSVVRERAVVTGLRGSDGTIEISEGLTEGERVVTFISE